MSAPRELDVQVAMASEGQQQSILARGGALGQPEESTTSTGKIIRGTLHSHKGQASHQKPIFTRVLIIFTPNSSPSFIHSL